MQTPEVCKDLRQEATGAVPEMGRKNQYLRDPQVSVITLKFTKSEKETKCEGF